MSDPRSWSEILIGVPVLGAFAGIVMQQRRQVGTLQGSLEKAHAALETERESFGVRMLKIEARLDKERDDCDRRHRAMEAEIDDLRATMRRFTPRDFPRVKEPSK